MKKNIDYYLSLKYPYTITEDDDGTFLIEYTDLKGCFTCGDSLEDALKMGLDAKKAWFTTALEEGIHIPEPKEVEEFSGSFRLRIPKSLHREIALDAKREGVSMNQYCVYLLSKENEKQHAR